MAGRRIQGRIIIEKRIEPNPGAEGQFAFSGDLGDFTLGNFSIPFGRRLTLTSVRLPGTYSVTEDELPTGYSLTKLSCDDANSTVDLGTRTATIRLEANETVRCTFTDDQRPGRIIIEKRIEPNPGAEGQFAFSGDLGDFTLGNFSIPFGRRLTLTSVRLPGTYSVTEDELPTGYSLTKLSCDDANSTVDLGTRTATIRLEANETVRCTFTDDQRPGRIIIEKRIEPNPGAEGQFAFSGDLGDFTLGNFSIPFGRRLTLTSVRLPGTYSVTEDELPTGYSLTKLSCDDANSTVDLGTRTATIRLEANETVRCTFTDDQRPGRIIIEKRIEPNPGAEGQFAFSGDLGDFTLGNFSIPFGRRLTLTSVRLPGTYSVTEDELPTGYSLTKLSCDDANSTVDLGTRTATIRLEANETVRCTFTDADPAIGVDGRGVVIIEKLAPAGQDQQVNPSATFSSDLDCVLPDDASTFTLLAGGDALGCTHVVPGTYTVTETAAVGAGAEFVSLDCDDANSTENPATRTATIRLEANETVRCTFVNRDRRGVVIIEKQAPAGQDQQVNPSATFSSDLDCVLPDDASTFTLLAGGDALGCTHVVPGTYTVTETAAVGAGAEFVSLDCDDANSTENPATRTATIRLEANETVRCTFVNRDRRGVVIIEKQAPAGQDQQVNPSATFSSDLDCVLPDDASTFTLLAGGDALGCTHVVPGTYTVTETAAVGAGAEFVSLDCDDANSTENPATRTATIRLEANETVRCTFVNRDRRGVVIIEKQAPAGQDQQVNPSATFSSDLDCVLPDDASTFTLLAGGDALGCTHVVPGTYTVTETAAVGAGAEFVSLDCDDANSTENPATRTATIRLEANETVRCTFVNRMPSEGATALAVSLSDPLPEAPGLSWTMSPAVPGCAFEGSTLSCEFDDLAPDASVSVHVTSPTTAQSCGPLENTATARADNRPEVKASATITVRCPTPDPGTIRIVKNAFGGDGTFQFTSQTLGDFSIVTSAGAGSRSFPNLSPGTYAVAETAKAGWDLASSTCSDQSTPAAIDLSPGETVTCTFVNNKRGSAAVTKTVSGGALTGTQSFAFQLRQGASTTAAGTLLASGTATAGNGGTVSVLASARRGYRLPALRGRHAGLEDLARAEPVHPVQLERRQQHGVCRLHGPARPGASPDHRQHPATWRAHADDRLLEELVVLLERQAGAGPRPDAGQVGADRHHDRAPNAARQRVAARCRAGLHEGVQPTRQDHHRWQEEERERPGLQHGGPAARRQAQHRGRSRLMHGRERRDHCRVRRCSTRSYSTVSRTRSSRRRRRPRPTRSRRPWIGTTTGCCVDPLNPKADGGLTGRRRSRRLPFDSAAPEDPANDAGDRAHHHADQPDDQQTDAVHGPYGPHSSHGQTRFHSAKNQFRIQQMITANRLGDA